jgi:predicted phosphodiesterase
MKIAVFSDVHGNLPGLQAVLDDIGSWRPDEVIVNGDLVSRGPSSGECLRLLKAEYPHTRFLKGNHEAYVLRCADASRDPADPRFELHRVAQWTADRLDRAIEEIRRWPDGIDLRAPADASVHITHGSRLGNRDGIFPHTADRELAGKLGDTRDLFIASHTHKPLIRRYNGTLVVNTGSVGQPLDGDPRAAYGRFELHGRRWQAAIVRVDYDRERAIRDFRVSGFMEECGPLARLIYAELRCCRPWVGPWMKQYLKAVESGQIHVEQAVDRYLASV